MRVYSVRRSGKLKGRKRANIYAKCFCTKCGRNVIVLKDSILSGRTTQCKLCNVKQGHETLLKKLWGGVVPDEFDRYLKTKWDSIKSRTEDPTNVNYHRYGGRGIRLSDEFQDPRIFVSYVKSLPNASAELQIDRIDNDRGYERGNLRWVTARENCNNRDVTVKINFNGGEMPLSEFVEKHTSLSYGYVAKMVKEGKRAEEILSTDKSTVPEKIRRIGLDRRTHLVRFNNEDMSLMDFARRFVPNMSYQNVLSLYRSGKDVDEIVKWKKAHHRMVSYGGESMTFPDFVRKHLKISLPYANRLYYKDGMSLEELVNWKGKTDVVTYKGTEMHFKDFVSNHTGLAYSTARKMYREGKSLDEIAGWKRKGSCV